MLPVDMVEEVPRVMRRCQGSWVVVVIAVIAALHSEEVPKQIPLY